MQSSPTTKVRLAEIFDVVVLGGTTQQQSPAPMWQVWEGRIRSRMRLEGLRCRGELDILVSNLFKTRFALLSLFYLSSFEGRREGEDLVERWRWC